MIQDKKDKGEKVFRLLQTCKENNLLVHFKFDDGKEIGAFKNGEIIDLNLLKLTLVLKERKEGIKPYFLENINPDSIQPFREEKK